MFCRECGTQLPDDSIYCSCCGTKQQETQDNYDYDYDYNNSSINNRSNEWDEYSAYYRSEFSKILESNENYKCQFNWAALFFGPLWALSKGLWLPALIGVALFFIRAMEIPGFKVIYLIYLINLGFKANYIYYCKVSKGKNLPF